MNFNVFFGVSRDKIKETCIICQTSDLQLFSPEACAGLFVKTAAAGKASVIALKNNFLAGDCVLMLKDSLCKNIILFGPCGGRGDIEAGDIIIAENAFNYESFSQTLSESYKAGSEDFDKNLIESFRDKYRNEKMIKAGCACVNSIMLEGELSRRFGNAQPKVFDMESSIVLSAAKKINAKSMCLLYVCDHIEKNPLGMRSGANIKQKISSARKKLAGMILDFCNEPAS
jgi:nucleoside phosphorylase